jgi:hypothetical protein
VTEEVAAAFSEAGIRAILLKGPAFARWLDAGRSYQDSDLLVEPANVAEAEGLLAAHGFTLYVDDEVAPEAHARIWIRPQDRATVDLHWTLPFLTVPPEEAWPLLVRDTELLRVRDLETEILGRDATALHAALHAALHGPHGMAKTLDDLARALERFELGTWEAAAVLARQLGAEAAFSTGLRLSPAGGRVAEALGLSDDLPPAVASRHRMLRLAEGRGLRGKAALVARLLVPPASDMRYWFPLARRGRAGLLASYPWRIVLAFRKLDVLAAAWRRARSAKGTSS